MILRAAIVVSLVAAHGDNLPAPCGEGYHVCDGQIRDPEGRAQVLADRAPVFQRAGVVRADEMKRWLVKHGPAAAPTPR